MQQTVYKIALVLAKIGVFLIAFLSLLGAGIVAITQYAPFRHWAIGKGLEAVNGALAGRLEVKDIEGNLLTGLTVREARLIAGDSTFVFVPRIELKYSLTPFFESHRIIASAVLHNPQINLLRNADGVWNFTQIARPSTDTTKKPRTPLQWTFDIRNLEIRDATLGIYDATSKPLQNSDSVLDLLHSTLDHFNLGLNAFISEDEQNIEIDNLSFTLRNAPFRLVELAGGFSMDEDGLEIAGLRIETGRSYVQLNASMDSLRLFDSALASSILRYPFQLELEGERVDTKELQMLLPALNFLGGTAAIDLKASGTFDDMLVDQLELKLTNSYLKMKGRLQNLRDPENFRIESAIAESKLTYEDVPIHIPGLPIPDLRYLGEVKLKTLTYSGTRRDLTSVFDISSDIGEIQGGGWFDYGAELPAWRIDAIVRQLDLSPVIGDPLYRGKINAHVVAEGAGFKPDEMTARLRMRGAASEVAGRKLSRLWLEGGIGDKGMITVDTLMLAWGTTETASILDPMSVEELQNVLEKGRKGKSGGFVERLRLTENDAAIFDGLPSLRLGGWYDMRNSDNPRYKVSVETDRLNVADITLDPASTTRLGLTLHVEGEGIDPDRMNATADLDVVDALLPGGEELRPFKANVSLKREGVSGRALVLESGIADASVTGEWEFATLLPTLSEGFDRLVSYISRKQSYGSDEYGVLREGDVAPAGRINAEYRFVPKDLSIVESFLKGMKLTMDAELSGEITGTAQLLSLTSSGRIRQFLYESAQDTLRFDAASVDINIRNISAASMDQLLDADIAIKADSLIRYNDLVLALPRLNLTFEDGVLGANGVATLNREYSVALNGTLDVSAPEGYIIEIDTLIFGLSRELRWRNVPGENIRLVLSDDKLDVQSFRFYRSGAEAISVEGEMIGYKEFRNMNVSVTGLPLHELKPFVPEGTLAMIETLNGTLKELEVTLNGTLENPIIKGSLDLDGLSYTTIAIGDLELELNYREKNLTGTLLIRRPLTGSSTVDKPLALVTIESMPIDLAFASREERLLSGKPLKITANASDLPIAIAGPFTTGLVPQQGRATLRFEASGIYPNISYSGEGNIRDGLVTVEATNVSYLVRADFSFQDRILQVKGVKLDNLPGDNPGGGATANGTVEFDGFIPKRFDIYIRPSRTRGILLLSDATQAVNENIYGDLVITATDEGGAIKFEGSMDEPRLTGNVTVLDASLVVPYRESAATASQRVEFIDYRNWQERQDKPAGPLPPEDDPNIKPAEELREEQRRDSAGKLEDVFNNEQRRRDSTSEAEYESDFVNNLDINLDLTLTDRVLVRIQLGPLQELALNLENGNEREPLHFKMKGDYMYLLGTVRLGDRSRFIYLKTFEARGTVNFNEDITNPEFDITGIYEGRRFINERSEDYTVIVRVTGPLDQLNINFTYAIAGVPATEDEEQQRINAAFLLLFGRRADENIGSNYLEGLVEQSTSSVGTSAVNAAISELIRNIEFLQALEIDLGQATDLGQARVNLVGQLGKTLVRYNGKVSSPEDGTISIEIPFSLLGDAPALKALVAELQREVIDQFETVGGAGSLTNSQGEVYRLRFRFRQTW